MIRDGDPGSEAEPRQIVSRLNRVGRCGQAVRTADKLLTELTDVHDIIGVLLSKLAALLNLNRMQDCPPVIDAVWRRLQEPGASQAQLGEFHGMAADVAFRQGSVQGCITHLVRGAWALDSTVDNQETMRAWLSTATAYSLVGFHRQAVAAQYRAEQIAQPLSAEDRRVTAHPEIRIRQAVALDQQGESEAAKNILADVIGRLGPDDVTMIELPYLGYAVARYQILGGHQGLIDASGIDARTLLRASADPMLETFELRQLGEATLAITEGRPRQALEQLGDVHVTRTRLGRAELPRLRTLAHTALGDFASAFAAQREVTSVLSQAANQLYDLFVDGVAVRLDYDELLRNVSRHADEAHTDPLTGLPNRRRFEKYVADLLERDGWGTIGVCDVDHFKDVNSRHGHLVGDQVLQQVAAILSRGVRGTDLLARFAGDEFVVVFTRTTLSDAREIADRLASAVAGHSWQSVAPGTPVSLTMGLAELDRRTSPAEAFQAADLLMLQAKQS